MTEDLSSNDEISKKKPVTDRFKVINEDPLLTLAEKIVRCQNKRPRLPSLYSDRPQIAPRRAGGLSEGGLSTMRAALVACFGNAQFFQQELTEDLH